MIWLPLTPRRSIPLGFLGMLALVWAVESFIDRHDTRFSTVEADTWKAARAATEHPPAGGVFLFGDSQVELGISPLSVESRLSQPVQCLALPGGQAPSSYFLLRRVLRAGTVPSAIVVDFEPQLLLDGRAPGQRMFPELADFDECLDLAQTMGDPDALASMLLAEALPSYRDRLEIRANLMMGLNGVTPINPDRMAMSRRNRGMNRGAFLLTKQLEGRTFNVDYWANATPRTWAPHPTNEAYTHRFLQLAAKHKIMVFCALMPIVPTLKQKAWANGLEPAYYAWLNKLQARYPYLIVLDWRNSDYPDTVFFDAAHLDVHGAGSVGNSLGDYLSRVWRGEGGADRWVHMPAYQKDGARIALEHHCISDAVAKQNGLIRR